MGNQQPKKKVSKATKTQIEVASLKAKIHLQLMRDRKNAQIIKGEKQLVAKIKSKNRNKAQQLLIAQRVVNGLKYAQACNQLMAYAASMRGQAQYLAQNQNNPQKIQPWLVQIYSLLYAANALGLSSLNQFKAVMKALNDPMALQKYVNPQIIQQLTPEPLPEEMNMYMVEMSERNGIPLQQINAIGHKFTKNYNTVPEMQPKKQEFGDMEKQMAEQMKKQQQNPNVNPNYNPNVNPNYNPNVNPNYNPNMNPNYNPNVNPYQTNQNPYQYQQPMNPTQNYNPHPQQSYVPTEQPKTENIKGPHYAYYDIDKEVIPPYKPQNTNPYSFDESQVKINEPKQQQIPVKPVFPEKQYVPQEQLLIDEPINPVIPPFVPVYIPPAQKTQSDKASEFSNPYGIKQSFIPDENPKGPTYSGLNLDQPKKVEYVPMTNTYGNVNPVLLNSQPVKPVNLEEKKPEVQPINYDSRVSINSLEDIEYFPELRPGEIDKSRFNKK